MSLHIIDRKTTLQFKGCHIYKTCIWQNRKYTGGNPTAKIIMVRKLFWECRVSRIKIYSQNSVHKKSHMALNAVSLHQKKKEKPHGLNSEINLYHIIILHRITVNELMRWSLSPKTGIMMASFWSNNNTFYQDQEIVCLSVCTLLYYIFSLILN